MPTLDLGTDAVTLTRALCDIPSVSGGEDAIADAVEEALRGAAAPDGAAGRQRRRRPHRAGPGRARRPRRAPRHRADRGQPADVDDAGRRRRRARARPRHRRHEGRRRRRSSGSRRPSRSRCTTSPTSSTTTRRSTPPPTASTASPATRPELAARGLRHPVRAVERHRRGRLPGDDARRGDDERRRRALRARLDRDATRSTPRPTSSTASTPTGRGRSTSTASGTARG